MSTAWWRSERKANCSLVKFTIAARCSPENGSFRRDGAKSEVSGGRLGWRKVGGSTPACSRHASSRLHLSERACECGLPTFERGSEDLLPHDIFPVFTFYAAGRISHASVLLAITCLIPIRYTSTLHDCWLVLTPKTRARSTIAERGYRHLAVSESLLTARGIACITSRTSSDHNTESRGRDQQCTNYCFSVRSRLLVIARC